MKAEELYLKVARNKDDIPGLEVKDVYEDMSDLEDENSSIHGIDYLIKINEDTYNVGYQDEYSFGLNVRTFHCFKYGIKKYEFIDETIEDYPFNFDPQTLHDMIFIQESNS